jgi:hypothetical protein
MRQIARCCVLGAENEDVPRDKPRERTLTKETIMYGGVSCFGNTVRSLAAGGLGVLLLLGGAGCVSEMGQGEGEEDVTTVSSALIVVGPNGHTYTFSNNTATWAGAKAACIQAGSHLASIRDDQENSWVYQTELTQGGGSWWLGYTDSANEGSWSWSDGMGQGYVNWNPGEPNNQGDEDCAQHWVNHGGKWNDAGCGGLYHFVCEDGGVEAAIPQEIWIQNSNTNSDTQNYVQFAVDLTINHLATIGTCGVTGGSGSGDTYLRLMNPNGTQLAENDDACGLLSQLSVAVPITGTYVIRGGCFSNTTCSGTVGITK